MRKQFEMTKDDLENLLNASEPTRVMKIGTYVPRNPQENANAAWGVIGKRMGFNHMTVQAVAGKSELVFTAEEI